jgi:hypothetical protein
VNKNDFQRLKQTVLGEGREARRMRDAYWIAGVLIGLYEKANSAERQALAFAVALLLDGQQGEQGKREKGKDL